MEVLSNMLLKVENVHKSFNVEVLKGISLEVNKGDVVADRKSVV